MTDKQLARMEHRMEVLDRRKERREIRLNKTMEYKDYPRFVHFKGTVLIKRGSEYWCYNGEWGISSYLDMGPFGPILKSRRDHMFKDNVVLIAATEQEWVECVGRYRPSSIKLVDGHVSFGKYIPNKEVNEWGNPCVEISLGESEPCVLFADIEVKNKYRYLLIAC